MAPKPDYFAQYLPRLIQSGYTAERALSHLRAQGLDINERLFNRTFAETQDFLSRREITETAPLNRILNADEVGTATRPRARGFLMQVELAVQDPDTNEVTFHTWGVRSQRLISPMNAIQKAIDDWNQSAQGGRNTPEGNPLGGIVTGAVEFVAPDDIEE